MKNKYGDTCYTYKGEDKYGFDAEELPFYGNVSLANGSMFKVGVFCSIDTRGRIFVGVEGHGAYTFSSDSHPEYVAEKLNLGLRDAKSMADFIEGQFGISNQHQDNLDLSFL